MLRAEGDNLTQEMTASTFQHLFINIEFTVLVRLKIIEFCCMLFDQTFCVDA